MSAKIALVLRLLLGLSLVVFGLNKFFFFISSPPIEGIGSELIKIYVESGFMKIIGGLEAIAGIGLLANRFVPLSLTFTVAILFNAVIFHILHDGSGLLNALSGLIVALFLVYANKARFKELLSA